MVQLVMIHHPQVQYFPGQISYQQNIPPGETEKDPGMIHLWLCQNMELALLPQVNFSSSVMTHCKQVCWFGNVKNNHVIKFTKINK